MVRLSAIIISLLLIFSFQAQAKNPPPGTGTSDIPANILIMLDNSGSMSAKLYSSVQVYYPLDVTTDSSGNVYVMEYYNNRIKVFDSSGAYLRSFGGYGYGCNQWRYARQFTIYNDEIYLADTYGRRILVMSLTGQCLRQQTSNFVPHSIAVNSQYVFVGNTGNSIEVLSRSSMNRVAIQFVSSSYINYAWGIALNSAGNRLLVANYNGNKVSEFTVSGSQLSFARKTNSSYSSSNGYFIRPTDVGYDRSVEIFMH